MTTVQNSTGVSQTLLNTMNGTSSSTSSTQAAQDKFLKLLVTQMKNQDPLNPMDNAQVTSQMAQLSTVEGINKLNTTVSSLISNVNASQYYQAANLIGKEVLTSGKSIDLGSAAKGAFGIELASGASNVKVAIKDASGKVVKELSYADQPAGTNTYVWDGTTTDGSKASAGKYTFEVTATKANSTVTATPLNFASVDSISNTSSGIKLNLSNLDTISTSDVKEIY